MPQPLVGQSVEALRGYVEGQDPISKRPFVEEVIQGAVQQFLVPRFGLLACRPTGARPGEGSGHGGQFVHFCLRANLPLARKR